MFKYYMFKYYMFALTKTQLKKNVSKHVVYFGRNISEIDIFPSLFSDSTTMRMSIKFVLRFTSRFPSWFLKRDF